MPHSLSLAQDLAVAAVTVGVRVESELEQPRAGGPGDRTSPDIYSIHLYHYCKRVAVLFCCNRMIVCEPMHGLYTGFVIYLVLNAPRARLVKF